MLLEKGMRNPYISPTLTQFQPQEMIHETLKCGPQPPTLRKICAAPTANKLPNNLRGTIWESRTKPSKQTCMCFSVEKNKKLISVSAECGSHESCQDTFLKHFMGTKWDPSMWDPRKQWCLESPTNHPAWMPGGGSSQSKSRPASFNGNIEQSM